MFIPPELCEHILTFGGPLSLFVSVDWKRIAATRIQRNIRQWVVLQNELKEGDLVYIRSRNTSRWKHGRVINIHKYAAIHVYSERSPRQYYFLPHPTRSIRYQHPTLSTPNTFNTRGLPYARTFGWHLEGVERYARPIPIRRKRGAIIWQKGPGF
eukprot:6355657-Prymnesium_polylepis.1